MSSFYRNRLEGNFQRGGKRLLGLSGGSLQLVIQWQKAALEKIADRCEGVAAADQTSAESWYSEPETQMSRSLKERSDCAMDRDKAR